MLNLFDYLTEEDREILSNYIKLYGIEDGYIGHEEYFKHWDKEKKRLFRLLGGLVYKEDLSYTKTKEEMRKEFSKWLYHNSSYRYNEIRLHVVEKISEKIGETLPEKTCYLLYRIFDVDSFVNNYFRYDTTIDDIEGKKPLKIARGIKPLKLFSKLLAYYDLNADNDMKELYEKIRLEHSRILNDSILSGTLSISIRPMDFMTMSDNNSDWSSCMSWMNNGCYHVGTVEMMNSNNVVCAYIESSKEFDFDTKKILSEDSATTWNNKKWRQLFYVTDEIIVGGKSYPYDNKDITCRVIEILRKLSKENLNKEYQFGIEPYKDMIHIRSEEDMNRVRRFRRRNDGKKHNIVFDTKGMYNDMLNDNHRTYYCVRNKVKKNTIISYSGKCPCLKCGASVISEDYDDEGYNYRYENAGSVICGNCKTYCDYCEYEHLGRKIYTVILNGQERQLCSSCINENKIRKCPICKKTYIGNGLDKDASGKRDLIFIKTDAYDSSYVNRYYNDYYYSCGICTLCCCDECYEAKEFLDDFEEITLPTSSWNKNLITFYITKEKHGGYYDSEGLYRPVKLSKEEKENLLKNS